LVFRHADYVLAVIARVPLLLDEPEKATSPPTGGPFFSPTFCEVASYFRDVEVSTRFRGRRRGCSNVAEAGAEDDGQAAPHWIPLELPAIDMKAASVGILDQVVAGLK
jgi:hypothetical protein